MTKSILREATREVEAARSAVEALRTPSTGPNIAQRFSAYTQRVTEALAQLNLQALTFFYEDLKAARDEGATIWLIGNGGSAANASHLANDLTVQKFRAIALADLVPTMSCIANDIGYEEIFSRQLETLMKPRDRIIAISSSGNSPNIIRAVEVANIKGGITHALVGFTGGKLQKTAQHSVYIPTAIGEYGCMEDVTLVIGHFVTSHFAEEARQETKAEAVRQPLTPATSTASSRI